MRNLPLLLLIFLIQCTSGSKKDVGVVMTGADRKDTSTLLYQYWTLEDADFPLGRDVIQKEDGKDFLPGIVFMNNGQLVENPGGIMIRATYTRNGNEITTQYEDGSKGVYTIKILNKDSMFLERKTNDHLTDLFYKSTNTWWPDTTTNPFTVTNFAWAIKPEHPETGDQIRQRVKDFIRFYQYYLEGYVRGDADRISFVGLPGIFQWYTGGIGLQKQDNMDPKWQNAFYNNDEADSAYTMVIKMIMKKFKWDPNEQNWIKQSAQVLKAMPDSL